MTDKEFIQDRGYAWVVLAASFVNNAIASATFVSVAVFMVDWMETFNTNKVQVTAVASVLATVACTAGIFVGPLVTRFGCRPITIAGALIGCICVVACCFAQSITQVLIFYGLFLGIGHGMYFLPPIIVTQFYFKKRRAFASGISLSGHSVGSFLFLPLLRMLVQYYGWRGALLIHAGFILQIVMCGALYRPVDIEKLQQQTEPQTKEKNLTELENIENGHSSDIANLGNENAAIGNTTVVNKNHSIGNESESIEHNSVKMRSCKSIVLNFIKTTWDVNLLKNRIYIIFMLSVLFSQYPIEVVYRLTALKATETEVLTKVQASFLPATVGGASMVSRVILSVVANLRCVNRTLILAAAIFVHSSGALLSTFAFDFYTYLACMVYIGIGVGAMFTLTTTTMVDILGVQKIVHAQAFITAGMALVFATSLSFAGYLIDVTDNYDLPYYIYGCFGLAGGVLMCVVALLQARQSSDHDAGEKTGE